MKVQHEARKSELESRQEESEELSQIKAELEEKKSDIATLRKALSSHEEAMNLLKTDLENKTAEHYTRSVELRAQQAQLDEQKEA